MKRLFMIFMATLLWVSCSSSGTQPVETPDDTPIPSDIHTPNTTKNEQWEVFWPAFQQAVAANDQAAVKSMTAFSNHLSESDFNDGYEVFFGEEMKKTIAETTAADVKPNEDSPVEVEDSRVVVWEETAIVDGEEMGSALFLYFGKMNGSYRLVFWMAAG